MDRGLFQPADCSGAVRDAASLFTQGLVAELKQLRLTMTMG
jgi:hypothetical protein